MVFNETGTPYSGIIQNIERESGLGLGVVSSNAEPDYLLAYFLGKINEWNHIINVWLHEVNDEITFDDINNTGDIPEEYPLTDDVQIYELDSDIVKIRKIEVKDAVSLEYYTLDYYYEKDRIDDLYNQDSDKPSKYFIKGRDLVFDVPVDITLVTKYRITYDRYSHEFVIGDTTAVPGFDKQFHWLLVYGPVMDWANGKYPELFNRCYMKLFGKTTMDSIGNEIVDPNSLKGLMLNHYQKQNRDMQYKIRRGTRSME